MPDKRVAGVASRARMFRNKGSMQIHSNREIHFPAVPYSGGMKLANILLLHYGNIHKNSRNKKYNLYTAQDPDAKKQAHSYDFLHDENPILKPVEDVILR